MHFEFSYAGDDSVPCLDNGERFVKARPAATASTEAAIVRRTALSIWP